MYLSECIMTYSFLYFLGGSVGGLHKSMTRLSSSQQINNQSTVQQANPSNNSASTIASNQTQSKWSNSNIVGGLSNKAGVSSGGVTVTTISPPRILRHGNTRSHAVQNSGQIIIGQGSTGTSVGTGSVVRPPHHNT